MAVKHKVLRLKKLGWRRVADEFMRLGWVIDDAYEETKTKTTSYYDVYEDGTKEYTGSTTTTKITISLHMHRDLDSYTYGSKMRRIDILFSIAFWIRRILGTLMPFNIIAFIIMAAADGNDNNLFKVYMPIFISVIITYFLSLILEGVFSRVGFSILQGK